MDEKYENLDGLRAISCLCLIAMHIKANGDYTISPLLYMIMSSWTHFVLLFILISGFGMCCGYYEKFKNKHIDLDEFYKRRYKKLLPFFLTLIFIDIVATRSLNHIIEGITEATLVFGLLPNNAPDVIGVSWTLGVIFLFYMLFPFIIFLCWTKKRAWLVFGISIMLSFFCSFYYFSDKYVVSDFTPRHNFLYCSPFIIAGILVYLYRETIKKFVSSHRWIFLTISILISVTWYFIPEKIQDIDITNGTTLIVFMLWLSYSIGIKSKFLSNKLTKFISSISMELYLSHMLAFRILERIKGLYLLGNGWASLLLSWIITIAILVIFIYVWKLVLGIVVGFISMKRKQ